MDKIPDKISKQRAKREAVKPNKDETKKADKKFTSYDTRREETSNPQKVREGNEPEGEQKRIKLAKGEKKDR